MDYHFGPRHAWMKEAIKAAPILQGMLGVNYVPGIVLSESS